MPLPRSGDEAITLPERVERMPGERVFFSELQAFLGCSKPELARFARQHGLLHTAKHSSVVTRVRWVTPDGALRIIAHFRAKDGEVHMAGKGEQRQRARVQRRESYYRNKKRAPEPLGMAALVGVASGHDRERESGDRG